MVAGEVKDERGRREKATFSRWVIPVSFNARRTLLIHDPDGLVVGASDGFGSQHRQKKKCNSLRVAQNIFILLWRLIWTCSLNVSYGPKLANILLSRTRSFTRVWVSRLESIKVKLGFLDHGLMLFDASISHNRCSKIGRLILYLQIRVIGWFRSSSGLFIENLPWNS